MRTVTATLSLAFTFLALTASPRAADEGGQAAACAAPEGINRGNMEFTSGGAWGVSHSLPVKVTCSTVRLSQGSPRNISLDYYDGSTLDGVSCTALAFDFNGNDTGWSQTKTSGQQSTGGNFFLFTTPIGLLGYIDVRCSLPFNTGTMSGIIGFNVQ